MELAGILQAQKSIDYVSASFVRVKKKNKKQKRHKQTNKQDKLGTLEVPFTLLG